jgi:predicted nucleic acid-binding protein
MQRSKILIDTDAFVSLASASDSGHGWAERVRGKLMQGEYLFFLTNFSYGEALTVISQRVGHKIAVRVAEEIDGGEYVLVEVDKKLRMKGLQWFGQQTSKNVSFTDCINMALMKQLKINQVFSRDVHYKKNGFLRLGLDG